MKTILLLGGARSGKSSLAVEMARKRGGKVYSSLPRNRETKR